MKKNAAILIGLGSLAVGAAVWLYLNDQKKIANEEKPPKRAPQLDIENPGVQNEFIPAASDSGLG